MAPKVLVRRAEAFGLDGVAITDHNTMSGVEPARRAASDDLLVISGSEIDTRDGQVIGLFLSEPIEPGGSPRAVIEQVHAQDGVALVPHPFDPLRDGLSTVDDHVSVIDAIETRNARCVRDRYNERARTFAAEHDLPETGGSDAHFARELGTARTEVELEQEMGDTSDVKEALLAGRVRPAGETSSILVHAGTKCVKLYNRVRRR